jgi:hypothetical protein
VKCWTLRYPLSKKKKKDTVTDIQSFWSQLRRSRDKMPNDTSQHRKIIKDQTSCNISGGKRLGCMPCRKHRLGIDTKISNPENRNVWQRLTNVSKFLAIFQQNSASLNTVKIARSCFAACGIYSTPWQNDVSLPARVTSAHTLKLQAQFHVLSPHWRISLCSARHLTEGEKTGEHNRDEEKIGRVEWLPAWPHADPNCCATGHTSNNHMQLEFCCLDRSGPSTEKGRKFHPSRYPFHMLLYAVHYGFHSLVYRSGRAV